MHILEIPSFFPPYGGLFCLDQAKALSALGHEVRILSNVQMGVTIGLGDYLKLPWHRYEHQMEGIAVCQSYQRGLPRLIRWNVNRWVDIVCSMFEDYVGKYGRPDILHAHCAKWAGRAALLISRKHGIPYVVTEHLPLMLLEGEFGKAPSRAWQIALLRETYEQADMVIPVSEELVEDVACYYGKAYRWQYVSNTIDTHFFHYQPREEAEGRPFRFCCLADYYYRKGYDVLFSALQKMQEGGVDVEVACAGLFTDSKAFGGELLKYRLNNVRGLGRVDKTAVRELLYQSDGLVLPSRSEVQPLVLLEAMSTGIPVISTECVPQSLRIEGGCTIVPIEDDAALADAMMALATSHQQADGRQISEQVGQLASPEVVGRRLESIFSAIVASRRQRTGASSRPVSTTIGDA